MTSINATALTVPPLLRGLRRNYYRLVVADPPWEYKVRSAKGAGRSASNHYKTMPLDEIAALPVARYAAEDSRLLLWITGPFLAAGAHMQVAHGWGYEPVAIWGVWLKPTLRAYMHGQLFLDDELFRMGLGHTTRQNAEYVVECRRGRPPPRLSKKVRQVFIEPRREHSRKPEKFYRNAEAYADGPRLELFARTPRPGWTCRGDEVGKFKP